MSLGHVSIGAFENADVQNTRITIKEALVVGATSSNGTIFTEYLILLAYSLGSHADKFYPHLLPAERSISDYRHFVSNLIWSQILRSIFVTDIRRFMVLWFSKQSDECRSTTRTTIRKIKMHFHVSRCRTARDQVIRNNVRVTGAMTRHRRLYISSLE